MFAKGTEEMAKRINAVNSQSGRIGNLGIEAESTVSGCGYEDIIRRRFLTDKVEMGADKLYQCEYALAYELKMTRPE